MEDYSLQMKFIDQSAPFAYGFECGKIWEMLNINKIIIKEMIHKENQKQIEMMCRRFLYNDITFIPVNDEWVIVNALPDISKLN